MADEVQIKGSSDSYDNTLKKIIDLCLFQDHDFLFVANYLNESIIDIKRLYYLGISLVKYFFIKYYYISYCLTNEWCL